MAAQQLNQIEQAPGATHAASPPATVLSQYWLVLDNSCRRLRLRIIAGVVCVLASSRAIQYVALGYSLMNHPGYGHAAARSYHPWNSGNLAVLVSRSRH